MKLYAAPLALVLAGVAGCSGDDPVTDAGNNTTADAGTVADAGDFDAGPQPCETWIIEYSMDGSEFEIRDTPFGAGDAVNTVGPGRVQLRFPGDDDGPQMGEVRMLQFQLDMDFDVAMVVTDVTITSGPDDCGVAMGTRTSSTVTWSTPIKDYHSVGTITCNAGEFLCGAAGLPEGMAVEQDSMHDQALMPFVFGGADDFSSFTMAEVEVPNDDPGKTFLRLTGTVSSMRCAAMPQCN